MFLEYLLSLFHIIECVLDYIEDNSVLVGVITSVIVSSLWLRKFLRQKRAEAFFGFYAKLSLYLRSLQARLDERSLLNTEISEAGNIYSLIYTKETIADFCPSFHMPSDEDLKYFTNIAEEIQQTLLNTESNVYPPKSDRKKWYESQHTLFSFCDFLKRSECQHITNTRTAKGKTEDTHIEKCKLLVDAINYILDSISNAKY